MAGEIGGRWSWEEDKAFETALAIYQDDVEANRWERIAAQVPGKSVGDVYQHYLVLMQDIIAIENGQVPIPNYSDENHQDVEGPSRAKNATRKDRHKGTPWSEEEHRSFLRGLAACGKGDWKRISREYVRGRTPQQVASHAQKYFHRQNAELQDKKRSSIHDINTLDHDLYGQLPVTGEKNQVENVHADYLWGNIYAGNQMESAYPEHEFIDAYAPIAMDGTIYQGNQTNAAENQNLMGDAGYPDHQTNSANNDHYGFRT